MASAAAKTPSNGLAGARRVDWVDGIRGAAAMFVVLHHMWLAVWPKFPRNVGPWWVGWMLYGHLAVAVFIVVSGFSLSLAPMRRGGTLTGGMRRFLRRRAWRIIPPYWAALVLSTIITGLILQPNLGAGTIARGFVVHGLLLQDIVGSVAPNGAFWSIAIEWQIYFVFPLILFLGRKTSIRISVLCTVALVLVAQGIAGLGAPLNKIHHLTPEFLALFACGVLAVQLGKGDSAAKLKWPLMIAGLAALGAFVLLAVVEGSVWIVNRYFWIDLLFGVGIACLMAVMFGGGLPRARRVLASRIGLWLGLFSYSIYLLHGPLVAVLNQDVIGPMHFTPPVTFVMLLAIGLPAILAVCYGFHLVFESPFVRCRDLSALRTMPVIRQMLSVLRRVGVSSPAAAASDVVTAREAT